MKSHHYLMAALCRCYTEFTYSTVIPGDFNARVEARLYNADGTPRDAGFEVSNGAGTHQQSNVTATPDGGFVVVWTNYVTDERAGQTSDILARIYGPDGQPTTGAFVVDQSTAGFSTTPTATVLDNGNILIGWAGAFNFNAEGRLFSPQGEALSPQVPLDLGFSDARQQSLELIPLDGGGFASIVPYSNDLAMVLFDDALNPQSDLIAVSDVSGPYNAGTGVQLENGTIAVAWSTNESNGAVSLYEADGTPIGEAFVFNQTARLDFGTMPHISALADGGFFVSWDSRTIDLDGVRGRVFNADGTPRSDEFAVSDGGSEVSELAQTILDNGDIVTLWTNGSAPEIQARIFDAQAVADNVEGSVGDLRGFVFEDRSEPGTFWDEKYLETTDTRDADRLVDGVVVNLLSTDGEVLDTALTNRFGTFRFDDIAVGDYRVQVETPEGFAFVTPFADISRGSEIADVETGTSNIVTVSEGTISRLKAGVEKVEAVADGQIRGYAFDDLNGTQVYDSGDALFAGVGVQLVRESDGVTVETTMTNNQGFYRFDDVVYGDYRLQFETPDSYGFVDANQGSIEGRDSDVVGPQSGLSELFTIDSSDVERLQAGLRADDDDPVSEGEGDVIGFVFEDMNGDGIYDASAGDALVQGRSVTLNDADTGAQLSAVTNQYGIYRFEGVDTGDYYLTFDGLGAGESLVAANQGPREGRDSDILASGRSDEFSLEDGNLLRFQIGFSSDDFV